MKTKTKEIDNCQIASFKNDKIDLKTNITSKRIGIARKELRQHDMTQEEFDSVKISF